MQDVCGYWFPCILMHTCQHTEYPHEQKFEKPMFNNCHGTAFSNRKHGTIESRYPAGTTNNIIDSSIAAVGHLRWRWVIAICISEWGLTFYSFIMKDPTPNSAHIHNCIFTNNLQTLMDATDLAFLEEFQDSSLFQHIVNGSEFLMRYNAAILWLHMLILSRSVKE